MARIIRGAIVGAVVGIILFVGVILSLNVIIAAVVSIAALLGINDVSLWWVLDAILIMALGAIVGGMWVWAGHDR